MAPPAKTSSIPSPAFVLMALLVTIVKYSTIQQNHQQQYQQPVELSLKSPRLQVQQVLRLQV